MGEEFRMNGATGRIDGWFLVSDDPRFHGLPTQEGEEK